MLPRLRFLLAAILIGSSMLVFGMGAIALLRASHQQFASTPPVAPPEPVFAQAPATIPSLSKLTLDPPADELPSLPPPDQQATGLTTVEDADVPPPSIVPSISGATPEPAPPGGEASDAGAPDAAVQSSDNLASGSAPPAPAEEPAPQPPVDSAGDSSPETAAVPPAPLDTPQLAARSDTAAETTGSIADTSPGAGETTAAATPLRDPPIPQARPATFAASAHAAEPKLAKPEARRKKQQSRRRLQERQVERPPPTTRAPSLGSLFGPKGWPR